MGLPDAAVKEARERVRAAAKSNGFHLPASRITVNLAPADTKKAGTVYDLPIFLGLLAAQGSISQPGPDKAFFGELSLGGELRPVSGALPMALEAVRCGVKELFVPADNADEAAYADGVSVYPVGNVAELVAHLRGERSIAPAVPGELEHIEHTYPDFADVKGQDNVKRAMEIAGKLVEEEDLREAMKENGIGRPSTRAAIIETLFKRRYIRKERKNLVATTAGIALIDTIKEELLKSAKLTGLWENKLRKIERREYDPAQFIDELKTLINEIVLNVLKDNTSSGIVIEEEEKTKPKRKAKDPDAPKAPRKPRAKAEPVTAIEQIKCPLCKKGHLLRGRTAYGCSEFRSGCGFLLPFSEYPADMQPDELAKKVKGKR